MPLSHTSKQYILESLPTKHQHRHFGPEYNFMCMTVFLIRKLVAFSKEKEKKDRVAISLLREKISELRDKNSPLCKKLCILVKSII